MNTFIMYPVVKFLSCHPVAYTFTSCLLLFICIASWPLQWTSKSAGKTRPVPLPLYSSLVDWPCHQICWLSVWKCGEVGCCELWRTPCYAAMRQRRWRLPPDCRTPCCTQPSTRPTGAAVTPGSTAWRTVPVPAHVTAASVDRWTTGYTTQNMYILLWTCNAMCTGYKCTSRYLTSSVLVTSTLGSLPATCKKTSCEWLMYDVV